MVKENSRVIEDQEINWDLEIEEHKKKEFHDKIEKIELKKEKQNMWEWIKECKIC